LKENVRNYGEIVTYEIFTNLNNQKFELQMWKDIAKDCGYDKKDNNKGFVYGSHPIDDDGQIMDCNWFKTNEERNKFMERS